MPPGNFPLTMLTRVRERRGSFSDGTGSNRPSIAVLAHEIFGSTRSFLGSLKRKGHALDLPIILRGDGLKPTHPPFPPGKPSSCFFFTKEIYCYGGTTFAIVVGDATKIVFEYNIIRKTHYRSDRGYTDCCVYSM
jgi:hypothetical protein